MCFLNVASLKKYLYIHTVNCNKFLFFLSLQITMSLNNAAKSGSKPHRERHQPQSRAHFGLLEKKKDYKLRAKDYNEKKEVLKSLRKKALNKNPDEFYFHMVNSKLTEGGHRDLVSKKSEAKNSDEQVKLQQTQDYKYISTRRFAYSDFCLHLFFFAWQLALKNMTFFL